MNNNMIVKKIGFACKWIDHAGQVNGIKPTDDCKKYNTSTTTVAWLRRQSQSVAEQKLWDLMIQNIESTRKLVQRVGELDEPLRMVRISSDLLPVYTHNDFKYFWNQADVRDYAERHFAEIGRIARDRDVRLSFHPGQYCVLASDTADIVERSIEEFEYHVDMARWMGYGATWHDHGFKINVHISGRQGPDGIRKALKQMTPEARNLITIENEENAHGLDNCLDLCDTLPIVLDIHHHWVREGEYITPDDERTARVIDSWRGVRPTCHYSVSREDVVSNHCPNTLLDHTRLLSTGHKKQHLRAHSNSYWNNAVNQWALSFLNQFDIMCESKSKNLASNELYKQWVQL